MNLKTMAGHVGVVLVALYIYNGWIRGKILNAQ